MTSISYSEARAKLKADAEKAGEELAAKAAKAAKGANERLFPTFAAFAFFARHLGRATTHVFTAVLGTFAAVDNLFE